MIIITLIFIIEISFVISQRYIANETHWRSVGDFQFYPSPNTSYGNISLHQALEMEFDFIYFGKETPNQWENVFRIGYPGRKICTEAGSRYPSMWIPPDNSSSFQISISHSTDCWDSSSPRISIEKNMPFHIVIRFNQTWKYASLDDGTETLIFIDSERQSPTSDEVLYTPMNIWFSTKQTPSANVLLSNVVINTWDPPTDMPTDMPTIMPTDMPTDMPSTTSKPTERPIKRYWWTSGDDSDDSDVSIKHSKKKRKWSSSDSSDSKKTNKWKHHSRGKYKSYNKKKRHKAYVQNEIIDNANAVDGENVYIYPERDSTPRPIGISAIFIGGLGCLFLIMVLTICIVFIYHKRTNRHGHIEVNNDDGEMDDRRALDNIVTETTDMIS